MDITLCVNEDCTKRKDCKRGQDSNLSEHQSYSKFEQDENGECEYFWEVEK